MTVNELDVINDVERAKVLAERIDTLLVRSVFPYPLGMGLSGGKIVIPIDSPDNNTPMVALAFGFSATLFERFTESIEITASKPLGANGQNWYNEAT